MPPNIVAVAVVSPLSQRNVYGDRPPEGVTVALPIFIVAHVPFAPSAVVQETTPVQSTIGSVRSDDAIPVHLEPGHSLHLVAAVRSPPAESHANQIF